MFVGRNIEVLFVYKELADLNFFPLISSFHLLWFFFLSDSYYCKYHLSVFGDRVNCCSSYLHSCTCSWWRTNNGHVVFIVIYKLIINIILSLCSQIRKLPLRIKTGRRHSMHSSLFLLQAARFPSDRIRTKETYI